MQVFCDNIRQNFIDFIQECRYNCDTVILIRKLIMMNALKNRYKYDFLFWEK